jgi:sec-independent protein translocase protein TatC
MAIIRRGSKNASPKSPDGSMTLVEHLRELRNRLFISVAAIFVGFLVGLFLYDWLFDILLDPYKSTITKVAEEKGVTTEPVINGLATSFILQLKVALVAGLVMSSPVWLYELWAFVMPGLHRNERKWTITFVAIAGPLFVAGVALGYYVMPKGLAVLLGFTPEGVTSLVDTQDYLNFMMRILLVFGVSFEIPLFVILLNLAGVVKARHLARWRAWIIFGTFVFAAVATPSTDPITMVLLAVPMVILFLISEVIARIVDRRRGKADLDDYSDLDDDEQSPL